MYELKVQRVKKILKNVRYEMDIALKERVLTNLSNCECAINDNNFDLDYSDALDYANQALEINSSTF